MKSKKKQFIVTIKPGDEPKGYVLLTKYGKEFSGNRFVWSTGEKTKRDGFNPSKLEDIITNRIEAAEAAYKTLQDDGTPINNTTLKERINLLIDGHRWHDNELHIHDGKGIKIFTIPDSVSRTELTKAVQAAASKRVPNYDAVVLRFISGGANELFGYWDSILNGETTTKSGKKLKPSTVRAKRVTYNTLKQHDDTLTFDKMTMQFYNKFVKWLEDNKTDQNSIGKHIKELKTVLNLAYRDQLINNVLFRYWVRPRLSNEVVALSKEDVIAIRNLKLSGTLRDVRDLFYIACFLGPRISDFKAIRKDNFTIKNGNMFWEYVATKTGTIVRVPVPPEAAELIRERWDDWPKMISEVNFRANLKTIAQAAELTERVIVKIRDSKPEYKKKWEAVSPHTARRTAASNLYYGWFSKPMPASLAMRYTGHKSEKSFFIYIGAQESDLDAKTLEYFDFQPQMKLA
jgi:integrase